MARAWIRLYTDAPFNAKLMRLPDHLHRFLMHCWCLTGSSPDECLPTADDIALRLHIEPEICQAYIDHLIRQNLLIRRRGSGKITPKDWDTRQFLSDSSTDRVRKFRETQKKPDMKRYSNGDVTPSDSEQTQTTEQNRTEESMRPEFDDQWQHFRKLYEESGKPMIEEDFTRAHHAWRVLDFEQKTAAIVGITNRYEAGEWDDPRYIPKPEKYLAGEYKRVVVAKRSRIAAQLGRNDAQRAAVDQTALGKLEAEAAPWLALHPGKTINDFVDWQIQQSVN